MLKNLIANSLTRFFNIGSNYIFIPFFIHFLGIEGYGFIGFYAVLVGLFAFSDFGITATATREMARLEVDNTKIEKRTIFLSTFEKIYFSISLFCVFLVFLLSDYIALNFLESESISYLEKKDLLILMAVTLGLQLPSGMYIGAFMGADKQVVANTFIGISALFRGTLPILLFWLYAPTIEIYFFAQILINFIYILLLRFFTKRIISEGQKYKYFDVSVVKKNFSFARGMTVISIIGIILNQADKIIISSNLTLESFGYYMLAFNISMLPIMMANIIGISSYPKLVELVEAKDIPRLKTYYQLINEMIGILVIPGCLVCIFFLNHLIFFWTGSVKIAEEVYLVGILLLAAQIFQSITILPYNFALSRGITKPQILVGIFSISTYLPALIFLTDSYGMLGAAFSWLALCVVVNPMNMIMLHNGFRDFTYLKICLSCVLKPNFVVIPILYFTSNIIFEPFFSRLLNASFLAIIFAFVFSISVILSSNIRRELISGYKTKFS